MKYIWFIYMSTVMSLFIYNTFFNPIGLIWLFKSMVYLLCFLFALFLIIRKRPSIQSSRLPRPSLMPQSALLSLPSEKHIYRTISCAPTASEYVDVWRSNLQKIKEKEENDDTWIWNTLD